MSDPAIPAHLDGSPYHQALAHRSCSVLSVSLWFKSPLRSVVGADSHAREKCATFRLEAMEFLDACARQAAAYPQWLVITGLVLTAFAVWWLVVKVLKWAFLLLFTCVVVAAAGVVFILFIG